MDQDTGAETSMLVDIVVGMSWRSVERSGERLPVDVDKGQSVKEMDF